MALPDLTPAQATQIAAAAGVDPSTVRRWAAGARTRSTTRLRIEAEAARLLRATDVTSGRVGAAEHRR